MKTKATLHSLKTIPVITINLKLPPDERWQGVPKSVRASALRLAKKQAAMVSATDPTGGLLSLALRAITKLRNPYRDDIGAWAELLGADVDDLLIGNFSYELSMLNHVGSGLGALELIKKLLGFACTSGAVWIEGEGMVHLRTLDWSFPGLGKNTVVYHMVNAPAGDFYNISFPGYVGVLTAVAPGRFSASINYATPVDFPSLDWPPSHLLRHIFENCADYEEALETLENTPTGSPALITLVGTEKNQAAIIECLGGENRSHPTSRNRPIAIANDFLSGELRDERCGLGPKDVAPYAKAPENNIFADERRNTMLRKLNSGEADSLSSAIKLLNSSPLRNSETKTQVAMCPRTGGLAVFGMEDEQQVSELLIPREP